MPILPCEPGVYPDDLLTGAPLLVGGRAWRVAHTKPRQEKGLARHLLANRVPFYLPAVTRARRSAGRRVLSQVPLFTGYVFLFADREERLTALAGHRIVRTLEVPDQRRLWADLRQVHRLIASGLPVGPEDRLAPGADVEVREGPLSGLRGRILRGAAGGRFVVQVDFIQRGASVWLDELSLAAVAPWGEKKS